VAEDEDTPTYASDDEREFCDTWIRERSHVLAVVVSMLGVPTHGAAALLLPLFVHQSTVGMFVGLHGFLAVLTGASLWLWQLGKRRSFVTVSLTAITLDVVAYHFILYYTATQIQAAKDVLWATMGAVAFVPFAIGLMPGIGVGTYILSAVLGVTGAAALYQTVGGGFASGIYLVFVAALAAMRYYQDHRTLAEAKREFLFRSRIAPAHVIRQAAGDQEFDRVFRPDRKFCVCISSDWRNYQELASGLSPEQLSGTLAAYYDLCESLLKDTLPEGNYYSDWIADELFVVIFDQGGNSEEELIARAVLFANRLIVAKRNFYATHGLPKAIDVGIAAGPALLGIMGPKTHRKVTALGETPGRSRRMQTAGKLLRHRFSNQDRVVFGGDVLMKLRTAFDVKHLRIEQGTRVRDVNDPDLYYIEPELATETRPANVA
jgi:hypothetical protein